jgi:uncharacterized protein YjbI with pentapeptide repeats/CheY-like chemotaxis protein
MASHDNNKKTILYADYSERNISAARKAVEPLGFGKFVDCDDRERTVDLIAEVKPDLVLVGLYLDGMRGISTIRAIRDAATDANPHGRDVPILLGAPKLDRKGMRDAVEAGIEGIFRQPIDPSRLTKIIETVIKKPRRFVLEDNYFGPARPQDLAKMAPKPGSGAPTPPPNDASGPAAASKAPDETEAPKPSRRHKDQPAAAPTAMATSPATPAPAAKPPATASTSTAATAPAPDNVARAKPARAAAKTNSAAAATGIAGNLDLADVKPRLNGAGQTFGDGELVGVPTARDRKTGAQNIKAVESAREVIAPQKTAAEVKEAEPTAEEDPDDVAVEDEELVEIDLQEALLSHKLWVDTGGKEGAVMSIEHADLREAELEGIDLSRCGLPFASFQKANCKDAVLRRCNLIAADFVESNLRNANLAASRLSGARFNKSQLNNTVFLGSDLSNASFRGMRLVNCDLSGTNLSGTDFRDADLTGARGLFAEQISRARVNANTRLPRNIQLRD